MGSVHYRDRIIDESAVANTGADEGIGGDSSEQVKPSSKRRKQRRWKHSEYIVLSSEVDESDEEEEEEEETRRSIMGTLKQWNPRSVPRSRSQASTPKDQSSRRANLMPVKGERSDTPSAASDTYQRARSMGSRSRSRSQASTPTDQSRRGANLVPVRGNRSTSARTSDTPNRTRSTHVAESTRLSMTVDPALASDAKHAKKEEYIGSSGGSSRQRSPIITLASSLVSSLSRSGKSDTDGMEDSQSGHLSHSVFPDKTDEITTPSPETVPVTPVADERGRGQQSGSKGYGRASTMDNFEEADASSSAAKAHTVLKLKRIASFLSSNDRKDWSSPSYERESMVYNGRPTSAHPSEQPTVRSARETADEPSSNNANKSVVRRGSLGIKEALKNMGKSRKSTEFPDPADTVAEARGRPGRDTETADMARVGSATANNVRSKSLKGLKKSLKRGGPSRKTSGSTADIVNIAADLQNSSQASEARLTREEIECPEATNSASFSSSGRRRSLKSFKDALKGKSLSRRNGEAVDSTTTAATKSSSIVPQRAGTPARTDNVTPEMRKRSGTPPVTQRSVVEEAGSELEMSKEHVSQPLVKKKISDTIAKRNNEAPIPSSEPIGVELKRTEPPGVPIQVIEQPKVVLHAVGQPPPPPPPSPPPLPPSRVVLQTVEPQPRTELKANDHDRGEDLPSKPAIMWQNDRKEYGLGEAKVVEDEMLLFPNAIKDDDEASFVSAGEMEFREDRGDIEDFSELVMPWADREERIYIGRTSDLEGSTDMDDEDASTNDGDEESDEDADGDNEGRVLSKMEQEKLRQEKEDLQVEMLVKQMSATRGSGTRSATIMMPVAKTQSLHNTNMDSAKKLEIAEINSRRTSNTESSTLVSRYRERRSQSEDGRMKKKSSFNPKVSSTARLLATGLNGDFNQTTMMFGSTDAMLDYIEDSETDETVYADPVKRSMKFAACRALIGDLLEESNVYDTKRLDEDDE